MKLKFTAQDAAAQMYLQNIFLVLLALANAENADLKEIEKLRGLFDAS